MDADRPYAVDVERLRNGRLARLQDAMRSHDVEACLLFNEPNTSDLFEHPNSMHLFGELEADVRPMHAWEFTDDVGSHAATFARQTVAAMRELGLSDDRLAIDRLGTPGFLAFQAAGISILDSATVTMEAREIKTTEEIQMLRIGGELVMEMLRGFEVAVRPGVTERELLAVLAAT